MHLPSFALPVTHFYKESTTGKVKQFPINKWQSKTSGENGQSVGVIPPHAIQKKKKKKLQRALPQVSVHHNTKKRPLMLQDATGIQLGKPF